MYQGGGKPSLQREAPSSKPGTTGKGVPEGGSLAAPWALSTPRWCAPLKAVSNTLGRLSALSRKSRKTLLGFCEATWRSHLAGLHAANGKRIVFDLSKRDHRKGASALLHSAWWILRTTLLSGRFATATHIKAEATQARVEAFSNPGKTGKEKKAPASNRFSALGCVLEGPLRAIKVDDDRKISYSFVGRALPQGTKAVEKKALVEHCKAFTRLDGKPSQATLESMRSWAQRWGEQHLPSSAPMTFALTAGGCLEKSRRLGGLAAFLVELYQQVPPGTDLGIGEQPKGIYDVDWESFKTQAVMREALLDNFNALERPLRAQVEIVSERGFKARVVTKSPGSAVALGHLLRKTALSSLRKDKRVSEVLRGDHLEAVSSALGDGVPGPVEVLSADLSAATDNLHHDVAKALWLGYCSGIGLFSELRQVGLDLLGPMHVTYPDKQVIESSSCGILMGLPLTWFILCLANMWSADSAVSTVRSKSSRSEGLGPQPYRICGDDLVGFWKVSVRKAYERNISLTGMKFSGPSKHLSSLFYGIFTEEVFKVSRVSIPLERQNHQVRLTRVRPGVSAKQPARSYLQVAAQPSGGSRKASWTKSFTLVPWGLGAMKGPIGFPLRGLVTIPGHTPEDRSLAPWWVTVGPTIALACQKHPKNHRLIRQIGFGAHPGVVAWAAKRGIPPCLPRDLGGFGLPAPKPYSQVELRQVAPQWARRAIYNTVLQGKPLELDSLSRVWTMIGSVGWRDLAVSDVGDIFSHSYRVLHRSAVERLATLKGLGAREIIGATPSDLEEMAINARSSDYCLMMGLEPVRSWTISPLKIVRALRKRGQGKVPQCYVPNRVKVQTLIDKVRSIEEHYAVLALPESLNSEVDLEAVRGAGNPIPSLVWGYRSAQRRVAPALGWEGLLPNLTDRKSVV